MLLSELLLSGEELAKSKHLTARALRHAVHEARADCRKVLGIRELSAVQEEMRKNRQLVIFVFVRVWTIWS